MKKRISYLLIFGLLLQCSVATFSQSFRFSEGLYRMPYENGTEFIVSNDVYDHNPPGKLDLIASEPNRRIIAAADGWVRAIQDSYDVTCFPSCCWQFNNYVILEHPNGEWSQYTHIQKYSATNLGISVGQWIVDGTYIGVEGNVGCSSQAHLHFEVARPDDPNNAFQSVGGFLNGELLNPVICGVPGIHYFTRAVPSYLTTGPCLDDCATNELVFPEHYGSESFVIRADNSIQTATPGPVTMGTGASIQFRAGSNILLRPGFLAGSGAKFQTVLRDCNEQN